MRRPAAWSGRDVPAEEIVDGFLAEYVARKAHRVRPSSSPTTSGGASGSGELETGPSGWSAAATGDAGKIGPYEIGLIERKPLNDPEPRAALHDPAGRQPVRRGQDLDRQPEGSARWPRPEGGGREARQERQAEEIRRSPRARHCAAQRRPDQALLLIYPLENPQADWRAGRCRRGRVRDQLPVLRRTRATDRVRGQRDVAAAGTRRA